MEVKTEHWQNVRISSKKTKRTPLGQKSKKWSAKTTQGTKAAKSKGNAVKTSPKKSSTLLESDGDGNVNVAAGETGNNSQELKLASGEEITATNIEDASITDSILPPHLGTDSNAQRKQGRPKKDVPVQSTAPETSAKRKRRKTKAAPVEDETPIVIQKPPIISSSSSRGLRFHERIDSDVDNRPPSNQYTHRLNHVEHRKWMHTYDQGKFSASERQRVKVALEAYAEENGIPMDQIHLLINRLTKFQEGGVVVDNPYRDKRYTNWILQVLRASRINRPLSTLHIYLKRAYSSLRSGHSGRKKRTAWTPEEDATLLHLIATKGPRWAEIEREMGKDNVRNHYNDLMRKSTLAVSGTWTEDENWVFDRALREIAEREGYTNADDFKEWSELAQKVKTRDAAQCRHHYEYRDAWAAMQGAFWTTDDDKELLNRMLSLCDGAIDETDIDWGVLKGVEWEKYPSPFLSRRWYIMKRRVLVGEAEDLNFLDMVRRAFEVLPSRTRRGPAKKSDPYIEDSDEDVEGESDTRHPTAEGGDLTGFALKSEPASDNETNEEEEMIDFGVGLRPENKIEEAVSDVGKEDHIGSAFTSPAKSACGLPSDALLSAGDSDDQFDGNGLDILSDIELEDELHFVRSEADHGTRQTVSGGSVAKFDAGDGQTDESDEEDTTLGLPVKNLIPSVPPDIPEPIQVQETPIGANSDSVSSIEKDLLTVLPIVERAKNNQTKLYDAKAEVHNANSTVKSEMRRKKRRNKNKRKNSLVADVGPVAEVPTETAGTKETSHAKVIRGSTQGEGKTRMNALSAQPPVQIPKESNVAADEFINVSKGANVPLQAPGSDIKKKRRKKKQKGVDTAEGNSNQLNPSTPKPQNASIPSNRLNEDGHAVVTVDEALTKKKRKKNQNKNKQPDAMVGMLLPNDSHDAEETHKKRKEPDASLTAADSALRASHPNSVEKARKKDRGKPNTILPVAESRPPHHSNDHTNETATTHKKRKSKQPDAVLAAAGIELPAKDSNDAEKTPKKKKSKQADPNLAIVEGWLPANHADEALKAPKRKKSRQPDPTLAAAESDMPAKHSTEAEKTPKKKKSKQSDTLLAAAESGLPSKEIGKTPKKKKSKKSDTLLAAAESGLPSKEIGKTPKKDNHMQKQKTHQEQQVEHSKEDASPSDKFHTTSGAKRYRQADNHETKKRKKQKLSDVEKERKPKSSERSIATHGPVTPEAKHEAGSKRKERAEDGAGSSELKKKKKKNKEA